MKYTETIICWAKENGNYSFATQKFPDTNGWIDKQERIHNVYYSTGGACWDHVRKATPEQAKTMCFIDAMHMIVCDGFPPAEVHRFFCEFDEYLDGLADDALIPDHRLNYFRIKRGMVFE
jgi:hypothetical protein